MKTNKKVFICQLLIVVNLIIGSAIAGCGLFLKEYHHVFQAIPSFVYAALIWAIVRLLKELEKHTVVGMTFFAMSKAMDKDLCRYKKLYGDLPKEEKKEEGTNEEKKEE